MPLLPIILKQGLDLFMGDTPVIYPNNGQEVGSYWANVIDKYTLTIAPPSNPGSRQAAKQLLSKLLIPLGTPDPTGQVHQQVFTTAFLQYATILGTGMAPAFTATPPPIPLGTLIVPVTKQSATGIGGGVTTTLSQVIDGWFRTGIAINASSGVSTPWT